jgi:hypothetical protein
MRRSWAPSTSWNSSTHMWLKRARPAAAQLRIGLERRHRADHQVVEVDPAADRQQCGEGVHRGRRPGRRRPGLDRPMTVKHTSRLAPRCAVGQADGLPRPDHGVRRPMRRIGRIALIVVGSIALLAIAAFAVLSIIYSRGT